MEFLQKLRNIRPLVALKAAGLGLVAIVLVVFVVGFTKSSFDSALQGRSGSAMSSPGLPAYDSSKIAYEEGAAYGYGGGAPELPAPNIYPIPPDGGFTPGKDAEEFEVTEYRGIIEARELGETCAVFAGLKARDYVVFESANEYDQGCNFSFKVRNDRAEEVLGIIKGLDPKELSQNTYTIKRQIENFTNETEILKKKLASIDETLTTAIRAYDGIIAVATRADDAESLAKIIDGKIQIIERLTRERININERLDRLARAKADQMDRLEYTYFYIDVREDKYIDSKSLVDSWKETVRRFVRDVNGIAQGISVNLVSFLLFVLQYAIYLLILILAAKYGWRLVRYVWRK